jgi:hypothetical protein
MRIKKMRKVFTQKKESKDVDRGLYPKKKS